MAATRLLILFSLCGWSSSFNLQLLCPSQGRQRGSWPLSPRATQPSFRTGFPLRAAETDGELLELQAQKAQLLREMSANLASKKASVYDELDLLRAARTRLEDEGQQDVDTKQEPDSQNTAVSREGEDLEYLPLPTGFDSLPWSEGYRKASERADKIRGVNTQERKSTSEFTRRLATQALFAFGLAAITVEALAPQAGQQQLDYINLIEDLEIGIQFFGGELQKDVYNGDVDAVASRSAPQGELERLVALPMEGWSSKQAGLDASGLKIALRGFRLSIAKLHFSAVKGDISEMKRAYGEATVALNSFIKVLNQQIPPGDIPKMAEVRDNYKKRGNPEFCTPDDPC